MSNLCEVWCKSRADSDTFSHTKIWFESSIAIPRLRCVSINLIQMNPSFCLVTWSERSNKSYIIICLSKCEKGNVWIESWRSQECCLSGMLLYCPSCVHSFLDSHAKCESMQWPVLGWPCGKSLGNWLYLVKTVELLKRYLLSFTWWKTPWSFYAHSSQFWWPWPDFKCHKGLLKGTAVRCLGTFLYIRVQTFNYCYMCEQDHAHKWIWGKLLMPFHPQQLEVGMFLDSRVVEILHNNIYLCWAERVPTSFGDLGLFEGELENYNKNIIFPFWMWVLCTKCWSYFY